MHAQPLSFSLRGWLVHAQERAREEKGLEPSFSPPSISLLLFSLPSSFEALVQAAKTNNTEAQQDPAERGVKGRGFEPALRTTITTAP